MTDPIHDLGKHAAEPLRRIAPQTPVTGTDAARRALRESEFRALLENLEASTEALEQRAASPADGESAALHDSLQQARDSFHDALEIGERLLEAYREARIDPSRGDPPGDSAG